MFASREPFIIVCNDCSVYGYGMSDRGGVRLQGGVAGGVIYLRGTILR